MSCLVAGTWCLSELCLRSEYAVACCGYGTVWINMDMADVMQMQAPVAAVLKAVVKAAVS